MVLVILENLDVGVKVPDGVLALAEVVVDGVAVPLRVHRVQTVHASGLVFDADLHLFEGDLSVLDVASDLFGKTLKSVRSVTYVTSYANLTQILRKSILPY